MRPPSGALVNSKEAKVNKTPFDFVPILQAIEFIRSSSLTTSDQNKILAEMAKALPPSLFCQTCPDTLAIIELKLGVNNGQAQPAKEDSTKERANKSSQGTEGQGKLLLQADADRGGPSPKKAVVKQKESKRRASTRNP